MIARITTQMAAADGLCRCIQPHPCKGQRKQPCPLLVGACIHACKQRHIGSACSCPTRPAPVRQCSSSRPPRRGQGTAQACLVRRRLLCVPRLRTRHAPTHCPQPLGLPEGTPLSPCTLRLARHARTPAMPAIPSAPHMRAERTLPPSHAPPPIETALLSSAAAARRRTARPAVATVPAWLQGEAAEREAEVAAGQDLFDADAAAVEELGEKLRALLGDALPPAAGPCISQTCTCTCTCARTRARLHIMCGPTHVRHICHSLGCRRRLPP